MAKKPNEETTKTLMDIIFKKDINKSYLKSVDLYTRVKNWLRWFFYDIKTNLEHFVEKIKDLGWFFDIFWHNSDDIEGLLVLIQAKLVKMHKNGYFSKKDEQNVTNIVYEIDNYIFAEEYFDEQNQDRLQEMFIKFNDKNVSQQEKDKLIDDYVLEETMYEQQSYNKIWDLLKNSSQNWR